MSHNDVCATITELCEKAESIEAEMKKNTGLGYRGSGGDPINPERDVRCTEAMARNRELKPKLIDVYNALGDAYQQKGNERMARFYRDQAERSR